MRVVRKIGLRKALRLFWRVFRLKYYAGHSEWKEGGGHLFLSLLLGLVFTFEPTACMLCFDSNLSITVWLVLFGVGTLFLAIPVSTAISLWRQINQNFDEFLKEMG